MSDRYHQPAPGTLLDTWGQVLNQNFFDIGNDVDQLFESMLSAEDLNPLHGTLYPQSAADIKIAIENAVDGAKIVIPSGTYAVDNLLNVRTNITLAGHGMRSTILNKTNDAPVLDLRNCNPTLRDFKVGSDIADTTDGIYTDPTERVGRLTMTNITANGLGNDGIHIGSANVSATQNIQANDNGRHGVYTGGDDANATTFINIDVSNNYTDGWHNAASYNAVVIGGYGHNNGRNAFYQGDNRGMLFGVGGESNVDSAVHVAGRRNFELSPIDHYAGEHHGPVRFSVIDPVLSFNSRSMLQCT